MEKSLENPGNTKYKYKLHQKLTAQIVSEGQTNKKHEKL